MFQKNARVVVIIIILAITITNCSPTDTDFYGASKLTNLDIASVLVESGDIPIGFYAGEITQIKSSDFPDNYYKFVKAEKQTILTKNGNRIGEVVIYLFESKKERDKLFEFLSLVESQEGIIPHKVTGIGECESCSPFATDYDMVFVFTRCASLAYIRVDLEYLQKGYIFDYLVAHAKRIDEQLKQVACQQS